MRFLSLLFATLLVVFMLPSFMVAAQTSVITPNENLVLEGIPPIPATLAETVNRYTNFRSAGLSSWHPARREMLISTRFADTPQVHLLKFPLGSRQQMTFFPERVGGGVSNQPRAIILFLVRILAVMNLTRITVMIWRRVTLPY